MDEADQVAAAVAELWGLPVDRAAAAPRGHLHAGWRLTAARGEWYVKRYSGAEWPLERVAETAALQAYLARCGLPVPAVHPDRQGRLAAAAAGGVLVAMDWVAGEVLPPAAFSRGQVTAVGAALGRVHRALSRYGGAPPPPFIPDPAEGRRRCAGLLRQLDQHPAPGVLHAHAAAALALRLAALDAGPIRPEGYAGRTWQPLHGDFYPDNLIWRAGALAGIVDFDFAGWNWRSMEVARAVIETAWTGSGAGAGCPEPAQAPPLGAVDLDRAAACLTALHAACPLAPADAAGLTRPWYNHLLHSVYPLHLYCAAPGSFPDRLVRLALRRHQFLAWLHHHGAALDELAARLCR